MLICGCGRWMHTQGVEERLGEASEPTWFVRSECVGCGLRVGVDIPADPTSGNLSGWIDRLVWSDDAKHRLDRCPPYVQDLLKPEVERYARAAQHRVVTYDVFVEAGQGMAVTWDPEARQRLERVPAPIRAMARLELERTAADRGLSSVSVALMEEVKAKYFGMAQKA
ncbi:MAG: PCP reductase family protein [Nitrospiraceae bacterium]